MIEVCRKVNLNQLIPEADDREIQSLFTDSRLSVENGIFFCTKGLVNDGHQYVDQAISNGAVCVVYSDELESYADDVYYYHCEDVFFELNRIASAFYNDPSDNLNVFAITGTNGKTTTALLVQTLLQKYESTGYIGTININYNDKVVKAEYTTPEVITLQSVLFDMVEDDVKSLAIEVSSHAIEQKRVLALKYDYAIFTNLSHEHLDYHGTMDNYFDAKAKLFSNMDEFQHAFINTDDKYGNLMLEKSNATNLTYAIDTEADYRAVDIEYYKDRTVFNLLFDDKLYHVESPLVARFNVYNLLASIAALHTYGLELSVIIDDVKSIDQVSGRVERIDKNQSFEVIVDYAHTPDGFESILSYAKEIVNDKRIISVFGSAGERDILKRKVLGEIADKYSDMIILTEDDPRKENVYDISKEIAQGISNNYVIIENRYDAIYQAVELANTGDIILVLGKGNDLYMATPNGREDYVGDVKIVEEILDEYMSKNEEEYDEKIH